MNTTRKKKKRLLLLFVVVGILIIGPTTTTTIVSNNVTALQQQQILTTTTTTTTTTRQHHYCRSKKSSSYKISSSALLSMSPWHRQRQKRSQYGSLLHHHSSTNKNANDEAAINDDDDYNERVDYYPSPSSSSSLLLISDDDEAAGSSRSSGRRNFDDDDDDKATTATTKGLLVLFTVPIAWGSFEPATRYLYAIQPPIPALVFSLSYYLVAAMSLLTAAAVITSSKSNSQRQQEQSYGEEEKEPTKGGGEAADPWPIQGGIELGLYLFIGNALQVFGLKTVDSDRAAFLLQLTTIFVPIAEAIISRSLLAVPIRTWFACGIALAGVAVMGLDGGSTDGVVELSSAAFSVQSLLSNSLSNWSIGDSYIVAAAVAYTFHCIRLEGYAKSTSAIKLAASKATTETTLSLLSVLGLILYSQSRTSSSGGLTNSINSDSSSGADFAVEMGREIVSFGDTILSSASSLPVDDFWIPVAGTVLWTGLITCAYTIYAQSYGQSRVRPVTANLIYTIQPVCTAIIAWLVLGESLGPAGYLGGALIASAVLLVAVGDNTTTAATTTTSIDNGKLNG